jgi:hypothetical protein
MIIALIIVGYVIGIFIFASAFNAFFEPNYPPSGKLYRFRYKVKSKITGKNHNIWQAHENHNIWQAHEWDYYKECDYPYLRAIFWPITLLIWLFSNGTSAVLEKYVERKRKQFQDERELKRKTQDYLNGKGEL